MNTTITVQMVHGKPSPHPTIALTKYIITRIIVYQIGRYRVVIRVEKEICILCYQMINVHKNDDQYCSL